jgi:hypothetical protein
MSWWVFLVSRGGGIEKWLVCHKAMIAALIIMGIHSLALPPAAAMAASFVVYGLGGERQSLS